MKGTMSASGCAWVDGVGAPIPSVYLGPAYQALLARHDAAEARVVQCSAQGEVAWLPLLVRDLGNDTKEAYSAYGYGGLIAGSPLSADDVAGLSAFLASEGIVAAFIRHAPFLGNERLWPEAHRELNRRTYAAELRHEESLEAFLARLPQKSRWSVQFARRAGLQVKFQALAQCPPEDLQSFVRLYDSRMQAKDADSYYLFPEAFFREHAEVLGRACDLAMVVDPVTGRMVAGALFLIDDSAWVHYHLSAASPEAMKQQGMELLLAAALHRYGHLGFGHLHLGGGHALDESDGLSRFKRKFANTRLDFVCSKLICDEAAYARERARSPLARPAMFLIGDARSPQRRGEMPARDAQLAESSP